MEEKLELKHLAPYLPYGLKVKHHAGSIMILGCGHIFKKSDKDKWQINGVINAQGSPILRPLSDLTKEDYHNIWKLETDEESLVFNFLGLDSESQRLSKFSHEFWSELYENHFDVFGLIPKGLAIDINTLANK